MARPTDPRLRPLVLDGEEQAERDTELRRTGLGPAALGQVQQWTSGWIRFGEVPAAFRAKRLGATVGAGVILLAAAGFAWLECDPDTPTNPPGGGYVAAAVFALAALGLLWGRRWMVPGRFPAPRVLVDLERRTTTTPRGPDRPWTATRWVLFKWHSHAGMSDTGTSIEFPLEYSWALSGFDSRHPEVAHHALSPHRQALLKDVTLAVGMEISEKLIEFGVCRCVDIDPPHDGRDTTPELAPLIRPGFRLWRPGGQGDRMRTDTLAGAR